MAEEMNIIGAESSSDLGQELNISLLESDMICIPKRIGIQTEAGSMPMIE